MLRINLTRRFYAIEHTGKTGRSFYPISDIFVGQVRSQFFLASEEIYFIS